MTGAGEGITPFMLAQARAFLHLVNSWCAWERRKRLLAAVVAHPGLHWWHWYWCPLPHPVVMTGCNHDLPYDQLLVGMGAGAMSSILTWCGCGWCQGCWFTVHCSLVVGVSPAWHGTCMRLRGVYLVSTPLHGPPSSSQLCCCCCYCWHHGVAASCKDNGGQGLNWVFKNENKKEDEKEPLCKMGGHFESTVVMNAWSPWPLQRTCHDVPVLGMGSRCCQQRYTQFTLAPDPNSMCFENMQ